MMYSNFTLKELYRTWQSNRIAEFFEEGLKLNNEPMAVTALEELTRRGESNLTYPPLKKAFENGQVSLATQFSVTLGNTLTIAGNRDHLFAELGKAFRYYNIPGTREKILQILAPY